MSSHYKKAYFLLSVAKVEQLPPDIGFEVAIVGRSNAGKSSVINKLTQVKQLARVSKTPGRTQLVNLFVIDSERRLADLPGYGFAKAPLSAKVEWEKTVNEYMRSRKCLKGLILVMDIRHPMRDLDWQMLEYSQSVNLPVHILLNKADKLSKGAAKATLHQIEGALTDYHNSVTLQIFSAAKGVGLEELYRVLDNWYEFKNSRP